jgi:ATP-dependent protease ClpP protease subunit
MKIYVIFLVFLQASTSWNPTKYIKPAIISSTILFNEIQPIQAYDHRAIPSVANQQQYVTSKVSVEKNNIYFNGEINTQSCEELRNKLNELDFNSRLFELEYNTKAPPINLHIQSTGGSLLDSLFMSDFISNMKSPVNTYVDGYTASAASLLSVVGSKRYMTKNSMILIHQLSSGSEGKYQDLDDNMKNLQQMMNKVKTIYMTKTRLEYLQLEDILKHDLWLDADTCKKYGLIDEII